jgi:hypothetical protein
LPGIAKKNDDLACRVAQGFAFSQHLARVLLNTVEAKNCVLPQKKLKTFLV